MSTNWKHGRDSITIDRERSDSVGDDNNSSSSFADDQSSSSSFGHSSVGRTSSGSFDLIETIQRRNLSLPPMKHTDVLTAADRELLLINSNEYHFEDGDRVSSRANEARDCIFWIMAGHATINDQFGLVATFGPGTLLVRRGRKQAVRLRAYGSLVLRELELGYLKSLLAADDRLAMRFFRRLATNITTILKKVIERMQSEQTGGQVEQPKKVQLHDRPHHAGLPHRTSTISLHAHTPRSRPTGQVFSCRIGDRLLMAHVKNTKLKLTSNNMGLHKKKRYRYTDLSGVARSSEYTVTILTKARRGKTLFFDDISDAARLHEILSNIVTHSAVPSNLYHSESSAHHIQQSNRASAIIMPPHLSSSTNSLGNSIEIVSTPEAASACQQEATNFLLDLYPTTSQDEEDDKRIIQSISEVKVYRKGEVIIAQGDLYQRIYQIEKGRCQFTRDGLLLDFFDEGDSFGELSIVQLRPFNVNVIAVSDFVEALIVS